MSMVIGAVAAPRRNFTRIANTVLDDESLPGTARWVFTVLSRFSVGRRLDETTLMRKADLAKNVLRRALAALESRGLITRRQQRRGLGFGDVVIYLGDPPLPMDETPRVARRPGNTSDQGKQDVSAGQPVARMPGDTSMSLQDDEPKDLVGAVRDTPACDPTPAPQTERGSSMTSYRQTKLPIIGPGKAQPARRPGTDVEPAAPGTVTQMHPQARALAAMSHIAATITDEWLQRCRMRPPTQTIRQVEHEVYALVVDAIPDDVIRRGMAAWMAKGYAPGAIPGFVNQVMNSGIGDHTPAARPSTTDARVAAALFLVGTFGEATG